MWDKIPELNSMRHQIRIVHVFPPYADQATAKLIMRFMPLQWIVLSTLFIIFNSLY